MRFSSLRSFVPKRIATRIVVIVVVMFVVCVGIFFYFWYIPPNTVVLREDGFHPRTLTVRAGETVFFVNKRAKYFWPASDFHPTHEIYPTFDTKEPLPPSTSWSFTFTEPGIYQYHDHLAAYFFGIIRVTDEQGAIVDDCKERGGDRVCWEREIFLALADKGLDAAYDVLGRLYREDSQFPYSCHAVAHNIGLTSYQFYREYGDAIFSPKAIVCAAGFYHGFMEGYLGATGDIPSAAALCDRIGDLVEDTSTGARLQCYHGVGHGAIETMIASTGAFNSLDEVSEGAVRMCEEASTGVLERYRCVSGIYNALANIFVLGSYNLDIKTTDPLLFCSRQKEEYKEACYGNFNTLVEWVGKGHFPDSAAYLLTMPDEAHKPWAMYYLASSEAVGYVTQGDFSKIARECRVLPNQELRKSCFVGFGSGLLEHAEPTKEYIRAIAFCEDPALSSVEREWCRVAIIGGLRGWYTEEAMHAICDSLPLELERYCAR